MRAYYLFHELQAAGVDVRMAPRDLVPHDRVELRAIARLPRDIEWADAVCIVGLPRRLLSYRLLTKITGNRVPVVLDFNDDPILQHLSLTGSVNPKAALLISIERLLFRKSSLLAFITKAMSDYYLERIPHPSTTHTIVVPNASDPFHFKEMPEPAEHVIGYVGGTSAGRGLAMAMQSLAILAERGHSVLFKIGCPAGQAGALSALSHPKVRVIVEEGIDYVNVPEFLARTQICLIPHLRNAYLDMIQPIKLFDYMAAGRAVVATDNPEQAKVLTQTGAGLVSVAGAEAFANAIERLVTDDGLRKSCAESGRRASLTDRNWRRSTRTLIDAMSDVG